MTPLPATPPLPHRRPSRGFTLAEAAVSTVLVGVLLVASLQAIGAAKTAQYKTSESLRAQLLADGLLAEILTKAYTDPGPIPFFGPEVGEASRAAFNDVDDYNGWTESPPQNADGTAMSGFPNWTRSVAVAWCPTNSIMAAAGADTGLKRITVTVTHNGVPITTATAIKANLP